MERAGQGAVAEREANKALCLGLLQGRLAALTVGEIAEGTGLSRPTVAAVVEELMSGSVVTAEERVTGRGRPAREFRFDADAAFVAGIDVGPHGCRVLVADLAGRPRGRAELSEPWGRSAGGDALIERVAAVVERACADAGVGREALGAVCLAVPGVIGPEGELRASLALTAWAGLPIAEEFGRRFGCPVWLENDIKLAALAEHRIGGGVGRRDIAYLQIGNRISLALVIGGEIRQGAHRIAGELGGLRGMKWTSSSQRGQLIWRSAPTGAELFALAGAGDTGAQREIADFCAEIAERIATVLLTVDPEAVVVGGGLARAGDALLEPLRDAVHRRLTFPERPSFALSGLGVDATLLGAVGIAFERASRPLYGLDGFPIPWDRFLG